MLGAAAGDCFPPSDFGSHLVVIPVRSRGSSSATEAETPAV